MPKTHDSTDTDLGFTPRANLINKFWAEMLMHRPHL